MKNCKISSIRANRNNKRKYNKRQSNRPKTNDISSSKDCKNCPKKETCIGKANVKIIAETIDKPYYDRMSKRINTKTGANLMKIRTATVEPVLGTLLHFVGMRKVYTKGIDLANKHVLLASTAYNIKKLLKFTVSNTISKVPVGCVEKKRRGLNSRISSIPEQLDHILIKLFGIKIKMIC